MVQSLDDARRRHGARSGNGSGSGSGSAGRVPPNNIQAEESLLGAMLLSRDAIAAAVETCSTDDFYKPAHGHVFDAICSLYAQGEPADPVTVADELRRVDLLDAIGGPATLITLQANTPATTNAARYARIVEEHALLRRLIGVAGEISEIGYGLPEDVDEAMDRAESLVFEVAERRVTDSLRPLHDLLSESLDRLEALYDRGEAITGVPTGFIDLDERLSGLQPSSLVIIGARPSMGKALSLDTPVPTPTGWTTMGGLRTGDRVLDDQGRPCTVTYATPVMHDRTCYRVTFDDGCSVVADAEHQWFAYDAAAWKSKRAQAYLNAKSSERPVNPRLARDQTARRRLPRVVTTEQMVTEGVRLEADGRPNWYLPLAAPLELPDQDLPLDPYLLGVWLGDGNSASAGITTADQEIAQAFRAAGYRLKAASAAGAATTYRVTYGHSTRKPWLQKVPDAAILAARARVLIGERASAVAKELAFQYGCARYDGILRMLDGRARPYAELDEPSFISGLRDLGVLRNKHIPAPYLRASRPQRLALLQGLMDTDGTVDRNGRVEIRLADLSLLQQVCELALSLGHKPGRIRRKTVAQRGRSYTSWRLSWGPLDSVFRLRSKARRLAATSRLTANSEQTRRAITSIERCPSVPVRCITVDSPHHLYLAGHGMIPTHNTAMALGLSAHAAMEAGRPVLFFSLEMSHAEVTQRLLCAEARVESTRVRNGKLLESDWPKISNAIGRLGEAPLYIDDNPNLTVMEIRAKARRLRSRLGDLGLIVVDYLQLMTGRHNAENRQVEVSEISRGLKILARELEVPVVALSQLSRQLEQRADKRPMLADLRESGCMPASTRLLRADNGEEVTLGELVLSQEQPMVWSLDEESWKLVPARLVKAFPSGIKPVFRLRLRSGYEVEATANHPFRTFSGWRRLDHLAPGDAVAVPRRLLAPTNTSEALKRWTTDELVLLAHLLGDGSIGPIGVKYATADDINKVTVEESVRRLFGISVDGKKQHNTWQLWFPSPYRLTHGRRHPIRNWLEPYGLWGSRSYNKFIPESILGLDSKDLALFLRHLWATDGSITLGRNGRGPVVRAYYASTSRRLTDGVRRALLRLGIRSRVAEARKASYRSCWNVCITGRINLERFLTVVGCHGHRGDIIPDCLEVPRVQTPNPNVDLIPMEVGHLVRKAMARAGLSHRALAHAIGEDYCGSYLLGSEAKPRRFSRDRLRRMAAACQDQTLTAIAESDVTWDEITEIVPLGAMPTFDATVAGTHNFIANGVLAHNSLEQDADVVMFLYRDEVYNPESDDRGTAEVIVSKHRNGPTGVTSLAFLNHYTRFDNIARI